MPDEINELERLNRRISDFRRGIEEAQRFDNQAWGGSERMKILDLLNQTLKDLEARKAALERPNP
jgi:hypothetical protein